ncbi:hypothetical protein PR003_g556 [Phytophthora rubi]|uniref:Secreted protein n=1 Tax=Phytophthora rubi TaxID=129364 RepID=A0A6A3P355_9STRA|nr:hypothetical protein PR002_g821 [Phytophthora rubi]KAE9052532.1 hypothetical protein PR001_g409 [Phytophthora rubi]KAE9359814.1 hypothetical protein PR003_g556 [Phytophthora rubi]
MSHLHRIASLVAASARSLGWALTSLLTSSHRGFPPLLVQTPMSPVSACAFINAVTRQLRLDVVRCLLQE